MKMNNKSSDTIPVLPLEGLIRVDTVLIHYQVSKSQLYQEIAEGKFPRQIKIGKTAFWDAKKFREFLKGHGAEISSLFDPPPSCYGEE